MKKLILYLPILLLFYSNSIRFIPKPDDLNYKMHAMFIYHFTKYINWPESELNTEFIIGVIGVTPLKDELQHIIKTKNINNKKVELIQLNENSEELKKCQIIFISEKESKSISKIYSATEKNPVLIITEKTGMLSKGASINFLVINEKLRFEISKSNVTSHNLKVSNELLKLASDVQ